MLKDQFQFQVKTEESNNVIRKEITLKYTLPAFNKMILAMMTCKKY